MLNFFFTVKYFCSLYGLPRILFMQHLLFKGIYVLQGLIGFIKTCEKHGNYLFFHIEKLKGWRIFVDCLKLTPCEKLGRRANLQTP